MYEVIDNLKATMVPPEALHTEASWDSVMFLRSQVRFFFLAPHRRQLDLLASKIFEGQRSSPRLDQREANTLYRSSSLTPFELNPTQEQWAAPAAAGPSSIHPGDVVLQRLAHITAAVVPPGLPSLPADANLLLVRGLDQPQAWWLAYCLNYPPCGDYLLSKSGRTVLGRVMLSVLRAWLVPEPPPSFHRLARRLGELLQKRAFLAGQIASLKAEVEDAVARQMAATAYEDAEQRFAPSSWSFFFSAAIAGSSWLPLHVASDYRAGVLHRDPDWQPLPSYLLPDAPSRNRFSKLDAPISVLRLSDVGHLPLLPRALEPSRPAQANRVYLSPVQAEDVLLSTLGSSPRVAFAPISPQPALYAVDHWKRLRFRSHAAAFALILQTGAITRQLRTLASGSVQQFIRPADIDRLFLPVFPEATLAQWDRSFRSLGKSWQQTDADWQAALNEGWQAFSSAYHLPLSETFTRTP